MSFTGATPARIWRH